MQIYDQIQENDKTNWRQFLMFKHIMHHKNRSFFPGKLVTSIFVFYVKTGTEPAQKKMKKNYTTTGKQYQGI